MGVGVDAVHGLALTVDLLESGDAAALTTGIGEIANVVGATVRVSDNADGFKIAADQTRLDQQVCIAHVVRNTGAGWSNERLPGWDATAACKEYEVLTATEEAWISLPMIRLMLVRLAR